MLSYVSRAVDRVKSSLFVKQVGLTFFTKLIIVLISFVSSIILARYLGPVGKGILAVLTTIINIAIQFGNLGLHSSNTYFIAKDRAKLPAIVSNSGWISFLIGGIIIATVCCLVIVRPQLIKGIPFVYFVVAVLAIPFYLLYMLSQNILLGIGEVKLYNILELFNRTSALLGIVLVLILLKGGVREVVILNTVLVAIFGLYVFTYLRKLTNVSWKFDLSLFKEMLVYGLKAYFGCLFAFFVLKFDILMVNYFLGSGQTGIYSIAVQIGDVLYLLPVAVGMILFPKLSGIDSSIETRKIAHKIAFMIFLVMLVVSSVIAIVSKPAIRLFYGAAFIESAYALLWLLPGIVFLSVQTIFMNYFASRGMPMIVVISPLLAMILNIVLNYYMIPTMGIVGAALASSIAYFLMLVLALGYSLVVKEL